MPQVVQKSWPISYTKRSAPERNMPKKTAFDPTNVPDLRIKALHRAVDLLLDPSTPAMSETPEVLRQMADEGLCLIVTVPPEHVTVNRL